MSNKVIFPLIAVFGLSVAVGSFGCHAEAQVGNAEPKVATAPPPPPEPPPPPPPAPEPPKKEIKATGNATIDGNNIRIPGKITFEVDKATIKEDKGTLDILRTVVAVLKENPQITKLHIEGHTDDSGSKDHNQKLSDDRAASVVEWLFKKGAVDKARLDSKGWGPTRPIVKNDTAANKETNRRVEFKIWELEGKPTDAQKNDVAPAVAGAGPGGASATPTAAKK